MCGFCNGCVCVVFVACVFVCVVFVICVVLVICVQVWVFYRVCMSGICDVCFV